MSNSVSENDLQVQSTSDCSIELKQLDFSNSEHSMQFMKSNTSLENHEDDETTEFMQHFVDILFKDSSQLTQELKSDFGSKSQVRCNGDIPLYV